MARHDQGRHEVADSEAVPKRLLRGAIGGFLAGLVFIGVTMWFVTTLGNAAEGPLRLISTLVLGREAMPAGETNVALGAVVHVVLSILFGATFGLVAPMFRTNGTVALAGGAFGALLYVVNFQVLGRLFFEQFLEGPNQPFEVVVHVVFGHLLAVAFYSSGVRRNEPFIDVGGMGAESATGRRTTAPAR